MADTDHITGRQDFSHQAVHGADAASVLGLKRWRMTGAISGHLQRPRAQPVAETFDGERAAWMAFRSLERVAVDADGHEFALFCEVSGRTAEPGACKPQSPAGMLTELRGSW
jgi:hypothetical protein